MKFTRKNINKLERLINETFDELEERPAYKLEECDEYIEFRVDGTLYEIVNRYYENIGLEINDYLEQFDNMVYYSTGIIRFYK